MTGTIRTYDEKVREQVHRDIRLAAEKIAESAGAKAKVSITKMYDTTVNDEALTARMAPVLKRAADGQVAQAPLVGASEDFSFFAKEVPGLYVFLGVTPRDQDPAKAAPNHSPKFFVDESGAGRGHSNDGLAGGELPQRRAGEGASRRGVLARSFRRIASTVWIGTPPAWAGRTVRRRNVSFPAPSAVCYISGAPTFGSIPSRRGTDDEG